MLPFFQPRKPAPRKTTKPNPPGIEALEDRCTPTCNIISGYVYQDANNNGVFDPGEVPIANSPIQLRNAAGQVVGSTTTSASGYYEFDHDATIDTSLKSLTETVTFQNTTTDFSLSGLLDRFDPALGQLQEIEITHGGSITSEIKVENFSGTSPSTISGTVGGDLTLVAPGVNHKLTLSQNAGSFNAAVYDGAIDFAGTSGSSFGSKTASNIATFTLTGGDLGPYIGTGQITVTENAKATSSASGGGNIVAQISSTAAATITVVYKYIPSDCLQAGNYTIIQTQQPAGLLDGKDSRNNVPLPNSVGADAIAVVLANADLSNNNFGEIPPPQLSGHVYHDANNNGVKDSGEQGIAGVTLTLTGTDDLGPVNKTATTDANGFYQFLNLRPGTYTIAEAQPAGWLDGLDTAGSVGGTVGNDQLSNITLPPGASSLNNNFGELKPASISGHVYGDANNNGVKDAGEQGIAGVTVALSGGATQTTTTDANGFYQFVNLLPGTYNVLETQPSAYLDGKDAVGTLGGSLSNDAVSTINVQSGASGQNYNFGELRPASLSGYVYADANNNGVKDPGESAISGVVIALTGFNDAGPVNQTATTDASGFYQFQNLRPGSYGLSETQPANYLDGKDTIGSQGGTTGNDQFTGIQLAQGTNGQNNNFGELAPAELSGYVYRDANDNGAKEAGESAIAGVTVTLTGANDLGPVNLTTTTDASGFYRFANLRPGTYTISETQPSGYDDGKDTIGSQGGTAGNDVFSNIALGAGVVGVNNNFGEIRPEIADLIITKTVGLPSVKVGQQLSYTLTINNLGEFDAKDVVVKDTLPLDATFVSAAGAGWTISHAGGIVTATRGVLAVNTPTTITVTIVVPAVSNTLVNEAVVTATTPDSNPLNNKATVTTPVTTSPPAIAPLATRIAGVPTTSKRQLLSVGGGSTSTTALQQMAFLDGLYKTLMGRAPTKAELNAALNRLQRGTPRAVIVQRVWNSDAHFGHLTKQLYNSYLHRLPSATESAAVVQQFRGGASETQIVEQLVTSAEYQAQFNTPNKLVGGLYLDLTGKLPALSANQSLVQSLNNQPLLQAVQGMMATQEALRFSVDHVYRTMLRRAATANEMQFGALQLQTGATTQAKLAIRLLSSNAFYKLAWRSVKR